ncbi:CRISPR-associated endonuclease Cas2 [Thiorhodovibrio frisius]|uniref:CRISPR-associated endoribonuclease Cas2 n=1 Tax=Thiorhodovibrio frisius TaxID=631362 RepID=H8Z1Q7_9GAMM|nr:CRISPR-associated endonuclease Cas2 [Thiorhodovibrio frisius]EIC21502.1 CRISPR-associated endoribonuclease Cas2 [Thiorhodovibrio frisius]WPL24088.1 CRISPR-associated endoribonuclease Cas2 [Thiorhodovibrio frisius]
MAANQIRPYLLAYDIADRKRLVRVHRTVKGYGMPLQYSVFLVVGTSRTLDELLGELDDIINPKEDDIRVYPLPLQFDADQYGRQWLPGGIDIPANAGLTDALAAMVNAQNIRVGRT